MEVFPDSLGGCCYASGKFSREDSLWGRSLKEPTVQWEWDEDDFTRYDDGSSLEHDINMLQSSVTGEPNHDTSSDSLNMIHASVSSTGDLMSSGSFRGRPRGWSMSSHCSSSTLSLIPGETSRPMKHSHPNDFASSLISPLSLNRFSLRRRSSPTNASYPAFTSALPDMTQRTEQDLLGYRQMLPLTRRPEQTSQQLEIVTPADVAAGVADIQGIPWGRFSLTREEYRIRRMKEHSNYNNVSWTAQLEHKRRMSIDSPKNAEADFYRFKSTHRTINPTIDHFQLRQLLWQTSNTEVFYVSNSVMYRLNRVTNKVTKIHSQVQNQLACAHVSQGLAASGAFDSEVVVSRIRNYPRSYSPLRSPQHSAVDHDTAEIRTLIEEPLDQDDMDMTESQRMNADRSDEDGDENEVDSRYTANSNARRHVIQIPAPHRGHDIYNNHSDSYSSGEDQASKVSVARSNDVGADVLFKRKISSAENSITNHVCLFEQNGPRLLTANNDQFLRELDIPRAGIITQQVQLPWAVNHVSISPDCKLTCLAGDSCDLVLMDTRECRVVSYLKGSLDFSFCSDWHNNYVATGSQDGTCRIWDARKTQEPIKTLGCLVGAARSVKFSPCGKFLAFCEPADLIHIYDTSYDSCQVIDFYGNIAGIGFSPDSSRLSAAIADSMFGCLMEFKLDRNAL